MSQEKTSAEQLARELLRESLFLPERWRVWLFEQLREDFEAIDWGQYRINRLNQRMSQAVKALERVAKHLDLKDQSERLALKMRQFDAAPESIRQGWKARRVADALRGSWQLATAVAFSDERLPVVSEQRWKRSQGIARKRREAAFALSGVQEWLDSNPSKKTRAEYDRWRMTWNKKLDPGQKPVLQGESVQRPWPFPWTEIVKAVEEQRLPGENKPGEGSTEQAAAATTSEQPEPSNKPVSKTATQDQSSRAQGPALPADLVLDPHLRARRIHSARIEHGWSLRQLGRLTGIDPSHLGKMEKGQTQQISLDNVVRLAQVLDLSLYDFITDDQD